MTFTERLARGSGVEDVVADAYFSPRGWTVSRAHDLGPMEPYRGPHMTGPAGERWALPDFLVRRASERIWVEVKAKAVFSWHRVSSCWVTGFDLESYEDYRAVEIATTWPVWLLFVHESAWPSESDRQHGCPAQCPTGVFGRRLATLVGHEHHRSEKWGRTGMVYWSEKALTLLAPARVVVTEETLKKIGAGGWGW